MNYLDTHGVKQNRKSRANTQKGGHTIVYQL